jgi:hypothetical protein
MNKENLTPTERVIAIALFTIVFLALLSGLVSCKSPEPNVPKTKTTYQIASDLAILEIVIIDSCEYLYGPWGNATVLTHKGNCKNPIHQK